MKRRDHFSVPRTPRAERPRELAPGAIVMERLGDGDFDPDDGVSMVASFPEVIGAGGSDYACPGCLRTICEAVAEGDVVGDVFECECGTLCRVRDPL